MKIKRRFPLVRQNDSMDCGPACLSMISLYYGTYHSLTYLRKSSYIDREGVSILGISEASKKIGLKPIVVSVPFEDGEKASLTKVPLPCIAHWNQNHFVVVYKVNTKYVWIADPASGKHRLSIKNFKKSWQGSNNKGMLLLLTPTKTFKEIESSNKSKKFSFLAKYFSPYKNLFVQLIFGLLLGTLFQLFFPFLTQSLVDIGIKNKT